MEQLAKGIYVETAYAGVNVGAILTQKGIIAVDTPSYPRYAREWAARLHRLSHYPVQFVVLTDCHGDRILNTRWFHAPIVAHQATSERLNSYDKRYPQPLLESLVARNPDSGRELNMNPVERPSLSFSQDMSLCKGEHEIILVAAQGPTAGNLWLYLPNEAILFAGDTVVVDTHPLLAEANSQEWLATLERLQSWPEEITTIVPGRGPLCDKSAIQPIRDYIQRMRQRVGQHVAEKRPREETTIYIPEFLAMFPLYTLPPEWMRRQIKLSLDRIYDEIKLAYNGVNVSLQAEVVTE
jgi:glyoxylase-like metal-dependent hydrolase (beta-lactamase superfamily II)